MQQQHPWPQTIEQAIAIQEQLRSMVIAENQLDTVRYVAGVDVGYDNIDAVSRAAVTVLTFPDLQLEQQAVVRSPTSFPYVPGFLSFREVPAVLDALEKISLLPDLILCDGQGIAHPRRFGLACHLGVLTNCHNWSQTYDCPACGVSIDRDLNASLNILNWEPSA
jgi:deoxyribonuclease V